MGQKSDFMNLTFCLFGTLILLASQAVQTIQKIKFRGSFNNYVDKMSGEGGQKLSVFVHAQGIKTVHARGGGQKWQNSVHVVGE